MEIAMVSEHASPLAFLGGVDAGGQNVAVAELSSALAAQGHRVVVYTRRDDPDLPDRVDTGQGFTVIHVPAGPPEPMPKDALLQYMPQFGDYLASCWKHRRPHVAHAHFWMSGLATTAAARRHHVPVVQTFHALGVVKRRHQGADDTSPDERIRLESALARDVDWVAATCTDEVSELSGMGRDCTRVSVVPCGVDPGEFGDAGPTATRGRLHRIVSVGRLVPRKGFDTVIAAMTHLPTAELVIVGGPDKSELGVRLPFGEIPLTGEVYERLRDHRSAGDLIAGIRPEHLEDASVIDAYARISALVFDVTVEMVESLGADKYVYFGVDGPGAQAEQLTEVAAESGVGENEFVARVPVQSTAKPGATLQLALNPGNVQLFDPRTGVNLSLPAAGT
ncbi:glycosyltransferase [Mycobacterium sp. NAZ190054]|uniref:glycosyltransferase n=1 Tax=Mycobacterium sp. NAZ190054 TaxID=1747766 RepID=UPI0009E9DD33|nr:glycosyltransferase [Mycobacterium sp. NAZ190054]